MCIAGYFLNFSFKCTLQTAFGIVKIGVAKSSALIIDLANMRRGLQLTSMCNAIGPNIVTAGPL